MIGFDQYSSGANFLDELNMMILRMKMILVSLICVFLLTGCATPNEPDPETQLTAVYEAALSISTPEASSLVFIEAVPPNARAVAIQVAQYRLTEGKWPEDLAQLAKYYGAKLDDPVYKVTLEIVNVGSVRIISDFEKNKAVILDSDLNISFNILPSLKKAKSVRESATRRTIREDSFGY